MVFQKHLSGDLSSLGLIRFTLIQPPKLIRILKTLVVCMSAVPEWTHDLLKLQTKSEEQMFELQTVF